MGLDLTYDLPPLSLPKGDAPSTITATEGGLLLRVHTPPPPDADGLDFSHDEARALRDWLLKRYPIQPSQLP